MTDQYYGDGNVITVTAPTGGATEGAIYRGADMAGVYLTTKSAGASVAVALEGEFVLAKTAGVALSVGEKLYATTAPAVTSATGASNLPIGICTLAAATGASTARVKLDLF